MPPNAETKVTKGELIAAAETLEGLNLDSFRKAIPKEAFVKSLPTSLYYLARDSAGVAAGIYGLFAIQEMGLSSPAFWAATSACWLVAGLFMWCLFVVAHDCGHGTFSEYTPLNDLIGNIVHGFILVPYWPWRLSHRRHHMFHNHIDKDYSHPWYTDETLAAHPETHGMSLVQEKYPLIKLLFPTVGWQMYLFGVPDGSHFLPIPSQRLWASSPTYEHVQCVVSSACVAGWLYTVYTLLGGSLADMAYYYLAPVMVFGWWLVCVTYLQHHSENTVVYGNENWKFDLAAFQTVDREYGWGLDQLMHHITDGHVAHHLFFTKIPHYNLPMATKAVQGAIKKAGLSHIYKREISHNFFYVLYDVLLRHGFKTTEIKATGIKAE